jgi:hypothetical protein
MGRIVEVTMMTRKKREIDRHDDQFARARRGAVLWLIFYALAITIGLISKVADDGAALIAAAAP